MRLPMWTCVVALLVSPCTSPAADRANAAAQIVVEPAVSTELFANPGMGWQTFHRFADDDKNLQGLPSSSAYFRFYWREIEPAEDAIDFARLDALLAHARKAGQKLALRVMCTGSGQYQDVPPWLKEKGCRGPGFTYGGKRHWVPDFTDPLFKEAHARLVQELGRRYDGHPDLDLMDIGSVGLWGEWHMSDTAAVDTGKPVPLPPVPERHAIIDLWCRAFPKTPKVILIGSEEGMSRTGPGVGWRADCLGDMGGFSKNWNHMDNFYRQQLAKTGALEAWRLGPVAFESCWDMRKWKESGWNIRHIFDYALDCHASYINNKSAPIPEGTREEIERCLCKLGYRLQVRRLQHPASARGGAILECSAEWENVGVAPPYRDYQPCVVLRAEDGKLIPGTAGKTIRGWLPGKRTTTMRIALPKGTPVGDYELGFGVVDPTQLTPAVRLANNGRDESGWYFFSKVRISEK